MFGATHIFVCTYCIVIVCHVVVLCAFLFENYVYSSKVMKHFVTFISY